MNLFQMEYPVLSGYHEYRGLCFCIRKDSKVSYDRPGFTEDIVLTPLYPPSPMREGIRGESLKSMQ